MNSINNLIIILINYIIICYISFINLWRKNCNLFQHFTQTASITCHTAPLVDEVQFRSSTAHTKPDPDVT